MSGVTNEFLWDAGLMPFLRWRRADGPSHGFHADIRKPNLGLTRVGATIGTPFD